VTFLVLTCSKNHWFLLLLLYCVCYQGFVFLWPSLCPKRIGDIINFSRFPIHVVLFGLSYFDFGHKIEWFIFGPPSAIDGTELFLTCRPVNVNTTLTSKWQANTWDMAPSRISHFPFPTAPLPFSIAIYQCHLPFESSECLMMRQNVGRVPTESCVCLSNE